MHVAAALLLLLASASAGAGPMVVRAADGSDWRVNDDNETRLERHMADGRPDSRFGKNGVVEYTLGHSDAGTAALRVDTAGRIWVAGTSSASGTSGPVVMRFLANGQIDTSWGAAGRDSATPPGQRLVVVDLLPMPDGSVWLAGNALAAPAGQHAAVWRLKPDGALDFSFGAGGLWQRPGRERTSAISLAQAPDGSVALGLEGPEPSQGMQTVREIYLLPSGSGTPRAGERSLSDDDDEDDDYLEWAGQGWRWESGDQMAPVSGVLLTSAQPATAGDAASDAANPGQGGFSPFGAASVAPPPPPAPAEERPWGLILGGGALVLALLALWGWRARTERKAPGSR